MAAKMLKLKIDPDLLGSIFIESLYLIVELW